MLKFGNKLEFGIAVVYAVSYRKNFIIIIIIIIIPKHRTVW